jgi:chaperonin cofactor prefoldin
MAETEAAPAVSTSEAVPEVVEAVPYDESLLIKDSKGKVKKPIKPDDSERNKQIEKLQEQITKHSDRIRDIKEVIESKRGSARSVGGGGRDIIKRLQDLRNQFQSVLVRPLEPQQ